MAESDAEYEDLYQTEPCSKKEKLLVQIDISYDTVCPWCYVGKKILDIAINQSKDQYNFEIKWHPFQLNPDAPTEGIDKREYHRKKFGSQSERMEARFSEVFRAFDLEYNISGLMGNTMNSHRLIYYAGQQGQDKQHDLVEELFFGYFTQGKNIGDQPLDSSLRGYTYRILLRRTFLLECAEKVGTEGAEEFLRNRNSGLKEVEDELNTYSRNIKGVPYYVINGDRKLSGVQPSGIFMAVFRDTPVSWDNELISQRVRLDKLLKSKLSL